MLKIIIACILLVNCAAWTSDWKQENPIMDPNPITFLWNNFTHYDERFFLSTNPLITKTSNQGDFRYLVQSRNKYFLTSNGYYANFFSSTAPNNLLFTLAFTEHVHQFVAITSTEVRFTRKNPQTVPTWTLSNHVRDPGVEYTSCLSLESIGKLSFIVGTNQGSVVFFGLTNSFVQQKSLSGGPITELLLTYTETPYFLAKSEWNYDPKIYGNPITGGSPVEVSKYEGKCSNLTLYDSKQGNFLIYFDRSGLRLNIIEINQNTAPIRLENLGSICHLTIGVDIDYQDILILGQCSGELIKINLASLLATGQIMQKTTLIPAAREALLQSPIKSLHFNYLQSTSSTEQIRMQSGVPVILVLLQSDKLYMYNLKTKEVSLLADDLPITSNILFSPRDANHPNPNFANVANLVVGLANGKIMKLSNLFFLQITSSVSKGQRRIYNNGILNPITNQSESFAFQGIYQKKIAMDWSAVAKSLIQFYLPFRNDTASKSLCQFLSFSIKNYPNCCLAPPLPGDNQYINSSFETLSPECKDLKKSLFYLLTTLDDYSIQTVVEDNLPSFNRMVAELTNNQPIVLLSKTNDIISRFVIIHGYNPTTHYLITWDPDFTSETRGEMDIPYYSIIQDFNYVIYTR